MRGLLIAVLVLSIVGCDDEEVPAYLLERTARGAMPGAPGDIAEQDAGMGEPPPPLPTADDDAGTAAPPSEPPPDPPPMDPPPAADDHQYCVDVVNRYRAMIGRAPLERATELEAFADEGAEEDTRTGWPHGHFSSNTGSGAWAENEIPSWPGDEGSVRDVIDEGTEMMWNEGPGGGHYENIIGDFTGVACGIYFGGGVVTIVQDFR